MGESLGGQIEALSAAVAGDARSSSGGEFDGGNSNATALLSSLSDSTGALQRQMIEIRRAMSELAGAVHESRASAQTRVTGADALDRAAAESVAVKGSGGYGGRGKSVVNSTPLAAVAAVETGGELLAFDSDDDDGFASLETIAEFLASAPGDDGDMIGPSQVQQGSAIKVHVCCRWLAWFLLWRLEHARARVCVFV